MSAEDSAARRGSVSDMAQLWASRTNDSSASSGSTLQKPAGTGSRKRSFVSSAPKCKVCNKSVYANEKQEYDKQVWHKNCFRCLKCNNKVSLSAVAMIKGNLYCKPCFKKMFTESGNYDSFTQSVDKTDSNDNNNNNNNNNANSNDNSNNNDTSKPDESAQADPVDSKATDAEVEEANAGGSAAQDEQPKASAAAVEQPEPSAPPLDILPTPTEEVVFTTPAPDPVQHNEPAPAADPTPAANTAPADSAPAAEPTSAPEPASAAAPAPRKKGRSGSVSKMAALWDKKLKPSFREDDQKTDTASSDNQDTQDSQGAQDTADVKEMTVEVTDVSAAEVVVEQDAALVLAVDVDDMDAAVEVEETAPVAQSKDDGRRPSALDITAYVAQQAKDQEKVLREQMAAKLASRKEVDKQVSEAVRVAEELEEISRKEQKEKELREALAFADSSHNLVSEVAQHAVEATSPLPVQEEPSTPVMGWAGQGDADDADTHDQMDHKHTESTSSTPGGDEPLANDATQSTPTTEEVVPEVPNPRGQCSWLFGFLSVATPST